MREKRRVRLQAPSSDNRAQPDASARNRTRSSRPYHSAQAPKRGRWRNPVRRRKGRGLWWSFTLHSGSDADTHHGLPRRPDGLLAMTRFKRKSLRASSRGAQRRGDPSVRSAVAKNKAHGSFGGAEGIRTPDLCSAIAALSHLSYSPAPRPQRNDKRAGGSGAWIRAFQPYWQAPFNLLAAPAERQNIAFAREFKQALARLSIDRALRQTQPIRPDDAACLHHDFGGGEPALPVLPIDQR